MAYVQRDQAGAVTAVFARPQAGRNLESKPDDDPEVAAFRDRDRAAARPPTVSELFAALKAKGVLDDKDLGR